MALETQGSRERGQKRNGAGRKEKVIWEKREQKSGKGGKELHTKSVLYFNGIRTRFIHILFILLGSMKVNPYSAELFQRNKLYQ